MDAQAQQLHIVIFPWLAFGHLLPCLDLADRLASRGHRVSFVSTPRNIARLPSLRPAVAPLVDFVTMQLPHVDGLPDGAESTNDVPHDLFELHRMAFDGLAAPFSEFLDGSSKKPDWVILDPFHCWAVAATAKHNISCAVLFLCGASFVAGLLPLLAGEADCITTKGAASGLSVEERCAMTLQGCQLVAFRSCVELEPESVAAVTTTGGKPFVTLGLLPPEGRSSKDDDGVLRWLDAQPAKSVVYVALGSEVPLRPEQVREMALGLELAGTRFVWALRKPLAADVLPPGFEERTRGHGLVAMDWVSQLSVLAHGAVAAFLTHCGWSSTIEGLLFGHPLVMLPITDDQWPNAEMLDGRGVGVQVTSMPGREPDRAGSVRAWEKLEPDQASLEPARDCRRASKQSSARAIGKLGAARCGSRARWR